MSDPFERLAGKREVLFRAARRKRPVKMAGSGHRWIGWWEGDAFQCRPYRLWSPVDWWLDLRDWWLVRRHF